MICNDNIIGPDVEMPLLVAQDTAHHRAAVDADAHVEVHLQWQWQFATKRGSQNMRTQREMSNRDGKYLLKTVYTL